MQKSEQIIVMILPHKYNLCRIIVFCLIWFSHHKSEKNNNIDMQLFFQKDNRWTQDVSCFSGSICNVGQTLSKANVFLSGDRVKYAKYKHITLYRHVIGFVHKLFNVLPFLHSTSLLLFLSLIIDPFWKPFQENRLNVQISSSLPPNLLTSTHSEMHFCSVDNCKK